MIPPSTHFTLRPYDPADAQSVVLLFIEEGYRALGFPRAVLDGQAGIYA